MQLLLSFEKLRMRRQEIEGARCGFLNGTLSSSVEHACREPTTVSDRGDWATAGHKDQEAAAKPASSSKPAALDLSHLSKVDQSRMPFHSMTAAKAKQQRKKHLNVAAASCAPPLSKRSQPLHQASSRTPKTTADLSWPVELPRSSLGSAAASYDLRQSRRSIMTPLVAPANPPSGLLTTSPAAAYLLRMQQHLGNSSMEAAASSRAVLSSPARMTTSPVSGFKLASSLKAEGLAAAAGLASGAEAAASLQQLVLGLPSEERQRQRLQRLRELRTRREHAQDPSGPASPEMAAKSISQLPPLLDEGPKRISSVQRQAEDAHYLMHHGGDYSSPPSAAASPPDAATTSTPAQSSPLSCSRGVQTDCLDNMPEAVAVAAGDLSSHAVTAPQLPHEAARAAVVEAILALTTSSPAVSPLALRPNSPRGLPSPDPPQSSLISIRVAEPPSPSPDNDRGRFGSPRSLLLSSPPGPAIASGRYPTVASVAEDERRTPSPVHVALVQDSCFSDDGPSGRKDGAQKEDTQVDQLAAALLQRSKSLILEREQVWGGNPPQRQWLIIIFSPVCSVIPGIFFFPSPQPSRLAVSVDPDPDSSGSAEVSPISFGASKRCLRAYLATLLPVVVAHADLCIHRYYSCIESLPFAALSPSAERRRLLEGSAGEKATQ